MNNATNRALNNLEITIIPIKQKKDWMFKKEHRKYYGGYTIKPNYIKIEVDDMTTDIYKRIEDSCYWRIVGLKGYEFALIIKLSI